MLSFNKYRGFIFSMGTYNPKLLRSKKTVSGISETRTDICVLV